MKYILAVSGGVDSVTLLDLVAHGKIFPDAKFPNDFVLAHFEHGIRGNESKKDAEFVRDLAGKYNMGFVLGEGNLPPDCNEETARGKRYEFLQKVAACHSEPVEESSERSFDFAQYDALIVTAHHRDDLIETIVMNLIRGTGWRGLAPMNNLQILRPLLNLSKFEIVNYALENGLNWVEDATNFSPNYFRNRVRDFLIHVPENDKQKLLRLYEKQRELRSEIEQEINNFCCAGATEQSLSRYFLTMIDEDSAMEILYEATGGKLMRPQLRQVLLFAKTVMPNKQLQFKSVKIRATKCELTMELL